MRTVLRAVVAVLLVGTCMGSSCWPDDSTGTTDPVVDGGASGAVVEITVDGVHVGPYATASSAYADLSTNRDGLGHLLSTALTLHAVGGTDTRVTSDLTAQRFGDNVTPFSAQAYTVVEPAGGGTPDRTVSLGGPIGVTAGNLTLTCSGNDCGAVLVVNVLDAAHIEGYLTASMFDPSDGQYSSVVVTFWVPWRSYAP